MSQRRLRRENRGKQQDDTLIDLNKTATDARGFFEKNQTLILGIIAAIVLIAFAVYAYNSLYMEPRRQEAADKLFRAQQEFDRDSINLALLGRDGDFTGFLDIAEDYGNTPAGNLAAFYAALGYMQNGSYDAAIEYLEDADLGGSIVPAFRYGLLGDAHSEKQDFDTALDYYEDATTTAQNEIATPYYLWKLGLLHEYQGNYDDAAEAYEEIQENYPTSVQGEQIEKYIERARLMAAAE